MADAVPHMEFEIWSDLAESFFKIWWILRIFRHYRQHGDFDLIVRPDRVVEHRLHCGDSDIIGRCKHYGTDLRLYIIAGRAEKAVDEFCRLIFVIVKERSEKALHL